MVGICRLCASLRKDDQLRKIKDTNDEICQKLQKCCHVQVRIEDSLPKCVCHDCVLKLDQAFAFYNRVHEAQEALTITFPIPTVKNDNDPSKKSKPTQTLFNTSQILALLPNEETVQSVKIKAENYVDDPLQYASAVDGVEEESLFLGHDFKDHDNESLLIENVLDERNHQAMNEAINGLRKRNISHDWPQNDIDGIKSIDMPTKRSRETNCNPTEEIIGMLKTVLKDQKKVESRMTILEKMIEDNVIDKSCKITFPQAASFSRVKINKDSLSNMHVEIANLLPLTSVDKINDLEEKLQNKIYADEMMTYLHRLKGMNGELDGVFRRLFSDDVLHHFNWDGRSTKKALQKLRLANDFLFDVFREDGRIQFEKDIRKCIELSHNRNKQKIYKKRNSILVQEN